ncbi:MAG TPA: type I glutamate--ammonia ligase [Aggregatilineales bacterium]|nr:type I glutamate--ammonia ligase [Chloroflexota bacterium]HOA23973.1 type I glutamate--ammonia ligase [Aggregatilineales bacterium]HQA67075.1 type I glutamate--ammonia ligase [Aggregatilineales bacterium]HQE18818.1 type I glutamate--ammonia ligase [Aggregatilineales bacterium]
MNDLIARARDDGIDFVDLQFTDIVGTIKSVTIPVGRLEEALERGVWFDGSSIQGFARIQESDMFLMPDPSTYRVLPWTSAERRRARLICDIKRPDGERFMGDPRAVLRRAVEYAESLGYCFNCGPELEFFLFKNNTDNPFSTIPHDVGGYFDFSPKDEAQSIRSDIVLALQQMGMTVEASHHEVATGQHEIDFEYTDALTAADNAVTFKYTVKAIAASWNVYATFMPKPIFGVNGSGMHTHQSLTDVRTGKNLFYDPNDEYRLSKLAYHFIAGQLHHARAMAAIVAPTVNSYKRLTPGYEAPVYISWAQINRSALIRIPRYSEGREQSTRVELRFPDPSCNPYLAFAAMLWAGLDGIEKEMEAPPPVNEDLYHFSALELEEHGISTLPGTLGEALDELEADPVMQAALGEHIAPWYLRAKRAEWDEYRIQISQWEIDRYLRTL